MAQTFYFVIFLVNQTFGYLTLDSRLRGNDSNGFIKGKYAPLLRKYGPGKQKIVPQTCGTILNCDIKYFLENHIADQAHEKSYKTADEYLSWRVADFF